MNPNESPDPLDHRLAELRGALHWVKAPAALDDALAARFRRAHAMRRPSLWWMPPLALAATVAIVTWMLRGPMPRPVVPTSTPAAVADAGPFLALKPLERIALEPGTRLVATEFPRALLADWGLPVSPERAGEPVRAEMLYSADGEALAVRLLN